MCVCSDLEVPEMKEGFFFYIKETTSKRNFSFFVQNYSTPFPCPNRAAPSQVAIAEVQCYSGSSLLLYVKTWFSVPRIITSRNNSVFGSSVLRRDTCARISSASPTSSPNFAFQPSSFAALLGSAYTDARSPGLGSPILNGI